MIIFTCVNVNLMTTLVEMEFFKSVISDQRFILGKVEHRTKHCKDNVNAWMT